MAKLSPFEDGNSFFIKSSFLPIRILSWSYCTLMATCLPSLFLISVRAIYKVILWLMMWSSIHLVLLRNVSWENCSEISKDLRPSLPSTANGIVTTSQEFNVLHFSHFNIKCDIWILWFFTASLDRSTENRAHSRALDFRAWTISSKYQEFIRISGTLRCGWCWLRCHFSSRTLKY